MDDNFDATVDSDDDAVSGIPRAAVVAGPKEVLVDNLPVPVQHFLFESKVVASDASIVTVFDRIRIDLQNGYDIRLRGCTPAATDAICPQQDMLQTLEEVRALEATCTAAS